MLEINTISDFYLLSPEQRGDICRNIKTVDRLKIYLQSLNNQPIKEKDPSWIPCKKCEKRGWILDEKEERRNDADIHASQIHRCIKNIWFSCTPYVFERKSNVDSKGRMIFDHGHMLHHMLQGYGKKGAWGDPKFYQDEVKIYPSYSEAKENGAHELPEAVKYHVRSSVDAILWRYIVPDIRGIGDVSVRLIHEYKSISPGKPTKDGGLYGGYASLKGPKPEHKQQASIYMQCFNVPITVFLYYDKGGDQIAEFPVPYDQLTWNIVRGKIKKVLDYVERNEMPPWEVTDAVLNPIECTRCEYFDICKPPKKFEV